jgi:hypothetical protein
MEVKKEAAIMEMRGNNVKDRERKTKARRHVNIGRRETLKKRRKRRRRGGRDEEVEEETKKRRVKATK